MAFNLRYVDYPASPDREFPCDLCPLSFDRQHDLKRHIETHSGEKPYLCDRGCGKAFTRKDALKRHQTTFPFCPPAITLPLPGKVQARHLTTVLDTNQCRTVPLTHLRPGLQFQPNMEVGALQPRITLPAPLPQGFTEHAPPFIPPPLNGGDYPASPTRPFLCDSCPLTFERHHDLKRHVLTHVGERPYVCNGCDKTFTRKDALKRHQLSKECGSIQ
ncbi:hypothetical protein DFH06DRAFT_1320522 [Mycena polygramma]|nr:hypothetical protein DFH06DRAFT_1320522 [Mycena polygramma]